MLYYCSARGAVRNSRILPPLYSTGWTKSRSVLNEQGSCLGVQPYQGPTNPFSAEYLIATVIRLLSPPIFLSSLRSLAV